jgi:hypothetical protein
MFLLLMIYFDRIGFEAARQESRHFQRLGERDLSFIFRHSFLCTYIRFVCVYGDEKKGKNRFSFELLSFLHKRRGENGKQLQGA